ncbi:MAG: leucyl aminopeptidase [Actinomycetaceae bacterium]|nr:leucyl aminopeptidase [Actinomycetaceae bacterium]
MTQLNISSDFDLACNLAVGVTKKDDAVSVVTGIDNQEFVAAVEQALKTLDASAGADSATTLVNPNDPTKRVIAVGVEDPSNLDALRAAAGVAARAGAGLAELTLAIEHSTDAELAALCEGVLLGAYSFNEYKKPKKAPVASVTVVSALEDTVSARSQAIAAAVNRTRDLVNTSPKDLNPVTFAELAEQEATAAGLSVKVFTEKELAEENLVGLLHVGAGSATPPRLVRLEWNPANASGFTALVGKGITFDTGGYSLKPSQFITEMKSDMAGAATVLNTLIAAAKLEVPRRVVGWLCMAENMVSSTAGRPDDVIVYRNGTSVEINNTDAEGRLVLADGLLMATSENPDEVIDIATLTGAQMVALGNRTTGVMGTAQVRDGIVTAADTAGEPAWAMPLPAELRKSLDSTVADMQNSGSRYGGMLVAGLFLKEFVGDTPWGHIDIAGPSFNREAPYGYTPKEATGVMLRTLVNYVER